MAFHPQESPVVRGFWERLIGMVKMLLKKVLRHAFITLTILQTTITEVEVILNDRPLTYPSSTTDDPEPLTPAHLLCGRRTVALPHQVVEEDEESDPDYCSSNQLRTKLDRQVVLLQHFQSQWFDSPARTLSHLWRE